MTAGRMPRVAECLQARIRNAAATPALISARMGGPRSEQPPWRRRLRRELTGLVALKIAALALLWWAFFSPAHRITVDGEAARERLGLATQQGQRLPPMRLRAPAAPASSAGSGAAR
jgi:hypothetical protein